MWGEQEGFGASLLSATVIGAPPHAPPPPVRYGLWLVYCSEIASSGDQNLRVLGRFVNLLASSRMTRDRCWKRVERDAGGPGLLGGGDPGSGRVPCSVERDAAAEDWECD